MINVGDDTGALVLWSSVERHGVEIEIHPVSDPSARTHVWVLPREGRDGVVHAAIFPCLLTGDYAVLGPDGTVSQTINVPPNKVTYTSWE